MKFKLIALSLCMIASANVVKGQEYGKDVSTTENKHEIRLSVSDGLTLGSADILGIGLSDAITGSKRTNQSNSMVYGIGYRYALNRFRLGLLIARSGFCPIQQPADSEWRKNSFHQRKGIEFPDSAHS